MQRRNGNPIPRSIVLAHRRSRLLRRVHRAVLNWHNARMALVRLELQRGNLPQRNYGPAQQCVRAATLQLLRLFTDALV